MKVPYDQLMGALARGHDFEVKPISKLGERIKATVVKHGMEEQKPKSKDYKGNFQGLRLASMRQGIVGPKEMLKAKKKLDKLKNEVKKLDKKIEELKKAK
jgi:hypothetical protein